MDKYNADSIETLDFRTAIRSKIEMYMGSADNLGVIQCIKEIISNSIDEFIMGYGNKIQIDLFENNKITIADCGRGCPFGTRSDGTEAMEAIFMSPHSGGKFNSKTYQSVIGMNGIGAKGVALSSKFFEATSKRNGEEATLVLTKGNKTSFTVKKLKKAETGTSITFTPDEEVFRLETLKIDFSEIKRICKDWAYLNKNLHFILTDHTTGEKIEYKSSKGIGQLLTDTVENPINKKPMYYEIEADGIFMEVAVQWSKNRYEKGYIFTNGLHNSEGGTPVTGIRTAVTRTINKDFKTVFSGDAARVGLNYVVNIKIPNPSFANQTKTKVNNPQLRQLADRAFCEGWKDFNLSSPDEVAKIKDFLTKEEKADKAAERARSAILNNAKDVENAQKKKVLMGSKLKDCEEHGEKATLVICEGDSALGGLSQGRPIENIALLPIRGKIINCLRHDIDKILENEEVKSILTALGCGIQDKYNPAKLRYGKIAIATDGDADGYNIMCLILTVIHELLPQFLEEGRLCWLRAPLYRIDYKGKESFYAFNDAELNDIIAKNGKGVIQRFKGLGEMEPTDTKPSMFGKFQRLERFIVNDRVATYAQLEDLMGNDVEPRKKFIFDNIDFSVLEE